MLLYTIPIFCFVASNLSGCADDGAQSKEKFAQVVQSAKKDGLMNKVDKQLDLLANRVGSKDFILPVAQLKDTESAGKAVAALLTYMQPKKVDPAVVAHLKQVFGSARVGMKGEFASLFDSAAMNLEATIVHAPQPGAAITFPNYAVYDFLKAVFHLLTDEFFEVKNPQDIEAALKCASGTKSFCKGSSNEMNESVISLINRFTSLIPSDVVVDVDLTKFVFAPLYIFFNHESIPRDIRIFALDFLTAGVELVENAPKDPQEAAEYYQDALKQAKLTEAEHLMLYKIQVNMEFIAKKFAAGKNFAPQGLVRLIVPEQTHV